MEKLKGKTLPPVFGALRVQGEQNELQQGLIFRWAIVELPLSCNTVDGKNPAPVNTQKIPFL